MKVEVIVMKVDLQCGCGWKLYLDGFTSKRTLEEAYSQQRWHKCYTPPVENVVDAVSSVGFQRVAEPEMDIGETYARDE